ncbi:3-oxo-5-alpha-steroid 4-dehydrogenase [Diaporthe amygdali]|uniref:3-oxo-5-alpha-steroid 4-dehydrogenase n=1 Tax=Phomopsis amygdali TaxID=1214568 RepID=UPI0022FE16FA|nr:3-oxo-5-alpha-steroid 4-dehydrogenase [Diaporthe amygdali]KAJ0109833.1 3-oxo-5-alpha-steroid 4-dehydrogenase [Diaporthe amygdali]
MALVQKLLHLTNFSSPFLRTVVPSVSAAFAIQAAFAVPSILAETERFYDFSGALTNISIVALSLYLPALRAKYAGGAAAAGGKALPSLLTPFTNPAAAGLNWRQVALTGFVTLWAARLGTYLFQRVLREGQDSRFDEIKKSAPKFFGAWMAQATWCSLICLPVIALNAVPISAFAAIPGLKITDVLGVALWVGGITLEATADKQKSQWMKEKREKKHHEDFMTRGLWQRSQYPNYFGESTLWTGIATTAAGVLASQSIQSAIGFSGGPGGILGALTLAYISPMFTTFLVTKVSGIPMSESKYDKRYGDRKDYQEWKKNTPKFIPKLF